VGGGDEFIKVVSQVVQIKVYHWDFAPPFYFLWSWGLIFDSQLRSRSIVVNCDEEK
jgi:hypothetical protein